MNMSPDKQDKCVNEVVSCSKHAENNFKLTKARDFALPVIFLVMATIVIAVTGADLKLSGLFCFDGKWPIGDQQPWHFLYLLDRVPSIGLGLCGLAAAIIGGVYKQRRSWISPGIFLVLLLTLGPGLVVNVIFKEYWGRPRPREVVQLGGKKGFLQPWQKGVAHGGRSFPSGHSSAAFFMTAPFFIYRRNKPGVARLWLMGGVCFGLMMSVARIAQGGHFLSDNLWAWGMVHLMAVTLYYLLKLDRDETLSAES